MSKVLTLATAADGVVSIASQAEASLMDAVMYNIPGVAQFTDKIVTGTYDTVGKAVVAAIVVAGTSKYVSDSWIPKRLGQ